MYKRNKYSYSKELREDVNDVFDVELSAECVRPLLTKLKTSFHQKQGLTEEQKKTIYKSYLR